MVSDILHLDFSFPDCYMTETVCIIIDRKLAMSPLDRSVAEILTAVVPKTVSRFTSIAEAIGLMKELALGSVIAEENGHVVGLFSERDFITKVSGEDIDFDKHAINGYMNVNPPTINQNEPIRNAFHKMTINKDHYLIVTDNDNKLASILSLRDLVRFVEKQLWVTANQSA